MGKVALLAVVAFGLFGMYYGISAKQSLFATSDRVADHQYEVLARSAALTGYNTAKSRFRNMTGNESWSGTHEGGSYTVTVQTDGLRAQIKSVGSIRNTDNEVVEYTVLADYERESPDGAPTKLPAFMDYSVISENSLRLSGNTGALIVYSPDAEQNANLHTNGNLDIDGLGNQRIEGFGSYVGTLTGDAERKFEPAYNPDDLPVTGRTTPVDIPAYDPVAYKEHVTFDQVTNGDVELKGALDLGGTRTDPYMWHIKGNVVTKGHVTVKGYALILLDGNATIKGNFQTVESGYAEADESSFGLYAGGDIILGSNSVTWGQLYARHVEMSGGAELYGSVVARGDMRMGGNPTVYYRAASPALTSLWGGNDTTFRLASYSEW